MEIRQNNYKSGSPQVLATPPASGKGEGRTPASVETMAETPVGDSPDAPYVLRQMLASPLSTPNYNFPDQTEDSFGGLSGGGSLHARTPPRSNVNQRETLLAQMEDAIPSPDSLSKHWKRRDFDPNESSSSSSDSSSLLSPEQSLSMTEDSLQPSKLSFSDSRYDQSMTMTASEFVHQGLSSLVEPVSLRPREMEKEREQKSSLARALFGWAEGKDKSSSSKPKNHSATSSDKVHAQAQTPNTKKISLDEELGKCSVGSPTLANTSASQWSGSRSLHPDESTYEYNDYYHKHKSTKSSKYNDDAKKQTPEGHKRDWWRSMLNVAVCLALLAILGATSYFLWTQLQSRDEMQDASDVSTGHGDLTTVGEDFDFGSLLNTSTSSPSPAQGADNVFATDNEVCSSAFSVASVGVTLSGSTNSATWDATVDTCGNYMEVGYASWFTLVANQSQLLYASTCGNTDFDTQITVTLGDSCDNRTCVAYNDQACGDQSRVVWYAEEGQTYQILVHGFRDAAGSFELGIHPVLPDEDCMGALGPIQVGSTVSGRTVEPIDEDMIVDSCSGDDALTNRSGLWYQMEQTQGLILAEATNSQTGDGFPFSVYTRSGSNCGELFCEGAGDTGKVQWEASPDLTYFILLHGSEVDEAFDLSVSFESIETCEDAIPIGINAGTVYRSTAASSHNEVPSCGQMGNHTAPGMWFVLQGTGDLLSASTCSQKSTLDTHISIFRGACGSLECIESSQEGASCEEEGTVSWNSEPDKEYFVYVSGIGGRVGDFALSVNDSSLGTEESCQSSVLVNPGNDTLTGNTGNASVSSFTCGNGTLVRGLWYHLEGTGIPHYLSNCNSKTDFDAWVTVFTGECSNLSCSEVVSLSCSELSEDSYYFDTVAGERYNILVHGSTKNDTGSFSVSVQEVTGPGTCSSAISIVNTSSLIYGNTDILWQESVNGCYGGGNETALRSSWYAFIGTGDVVTFNTCFENTTFQTAVHVYGGTCSNISCVETGTSYCATKHSIVSLETVVDESYFVRVTGINANESGAFVMDVSMRSMP